MKQDTGCTRAFSVQVKRSATSPLEAVLTFSIGLDTILAHKPGLGVNSLRGALAALTAATDERLAELAQELEKQLTGCVLVDPTRPVGRDLANAIMDCVERWETQERREKQAQEEQRRKVQQDMLAGLANRLVEAVPSWRGPLPLAEVFPEWLAFTPEAREEVARLASCRVVLECRDDVWFVCSRAAWGWDLRGVTDPETRSALPALAHSGRGGLPRWLAGRKISGKLGGPKCFH